MLLFSKYENAFDNIFISQPVVDIDIEDSNCFIVRFPKFRRITHFILSFDAENLFFDSESNKDMLIENKNVITHENNQKIADVFLVGDKVFHQKFGYGIVKDIEGNNAEVSFTKSNIKKVKIEFLIKNV